MKITVAAFLFTERNVEIEHLEIENLKNLALKNLGKKLKQILISESAAVDKVIDVVAHTQHKTVAGILLNI